MISSWLIFEWENFGFAPKGNWRNRRLNRIIVNRIGFTFKHGPKTRGEQKIMHLILSRPRGFCAGVNAAISALNEAIYRFGVPFYVFHEIVHNTHVVEGFRKKGVVFVDSLKEVPRGARLMFSAHGVSPEIREQAKRRNLHTIDATCPLVRKVHEEVVRLSRAGFQILLLGHPGHDEVVAVMNEAPEHIRLIARESDMDSLRFGPEEKVAYVMQTTLSISESKGMIQKLRKKIPGIIAPPTADVCFATQNRQDAVHQLAKQADVLIVHGSQNSSNSRRLAEIGTALGIPSFLIDSVEELDVSFFNGDERILITSGASAPESVVQYTVEKLVETFGASVEERIIHEESIRFALPRELRMSERET